MRQYEKVDCIEDVKEGQKLEIGVSHINACIGGQVDLVLVFGNPKTMKNVWVPYNSKVEIDGREYKVLRGKLNRDVGDRLFTHDQSIECLLDKEGKLHHMSDFCPRYTKRKEEVIIKEIYNSKWGAFLQYWFDRRHRKLEQADTSSMEQFVRYGIRKPWQSGFAALRDKIDRMTKL